MSATFYFSKLNLNSHILEVYKKEEEIKTILEILFLKVKNDVSFKQVEIKYDGEEEHTYEALFSFKQIQKYDDNTITGQVIKTSNLYVNKLLEESGEIKKTPVKNTEVIPFYFDIHKEIVAFITTNRFGYKTFNEAFIKLINDSINDKDTEDKYSNDEVTFNFKIALLKKGLSIETLTSELKRIGEIKTLKIEIIPPNVDDETISGIQETAEETLENIIEGNVTSKSIIFESTAPKGLNIDSALIKKELNAVGNIHSKISAEKAITNGYANVEAQNKKGRVYSTDAEDPIKYKVDKKPSTLDDFIDACKLAIRSII